MIRHFGKSIICFALLSSTAANASYYPVEGYETNWRDPRINTVFTASRNSVKAKLTVSDNVFDGGPVDKCRGKLALFINSRKIQEDETGNMRDIACPYIQLNEKKRSQVSVFVSRPDESDLDVFSYMYGGPKIKFRRSELPSFDYMTDSAKIYAQRESALGDTKATLSWNKQDSHDAQDWSFSISKSKKCLLSQKLEATELLASEDHTPSYSGPYLVSLNGDGAVQIIIRINTWIRENTSYRTSYDRVYYLDRKSGKYKFTSHYWRGNYARFADLDKDGKTQWISENYQLQKDCWADPSMKIDTSGGPLQIFAWGKNNKLSDVTRKYPEEIRKHAAAYLESAKLRNDCDIVSYVADLALLGEKKKALAELKRLETSNIKKMRRQIIAQLKKKAYL